jgi:hypothetical protein
LEDNKRIAGKIKGTARIAVKVAAVEKKVEDIICGNCHKKGHIRLDCRFAPSCGKTPRFCPVQIKWDIEHPKATFSKKFSTPVYKSHNARLTQVSNDSRTAAALEKVRPRSSKRELKSSHTSIATSCNPPRSSARDKPLASLEEFEVDAPALVDTGCNGFIASSKSQLDKTSNSSNFSQVTVGMPDSSIVSSTINGKFAGFPAHVVKEFNTTLVPADFLRRTMHC